MKRLKSQGEKREKKGDKGRQRETKGDRGRQRETKQTKGHKEAKEDTGINFRNLNSNNLKMGWFEECSPKVPGNLQSSIFKPIGVFLKKNLKNF